MDEGGSGPGLRAKDDSSNDAGLGNAREATQANTDYAENQGYLGSGLFSDQRYSEAEAAYREAILLDPGNARHYSDLATALFAQAKYGAAEAAALEALRLDPDNAQYHDNLGEYLLAQDEYVKAEAACRRAVELDPGNPAYLNDLGRTLYPQERYAEAEEAQRKAIRFGKSADGSSVISVELYAQFYNNLGDNLFNQRRYGEAEGAYRDACHIDPDSARNHNDFGATLFVEGKYEEAEAEHRVAVRLDPGNALFRNNLGDTLFALKRYDQAEEANRGAVDLAGDVDVYHHDLGAALYMQERYPEAESEYREAMRLDQTDARYPNSLGLCLLAQHRYHDAETAEREALRLDPENTEYRDNLANILFAHARQAFTEKRLDESEKALREAMRLRSTNARYHNSLGVVLLIAQRYDEAEAEQREAVRLDPAAAAYYNDLGVALLARARFAPASSAAGAEANNPHTAALDQAKGLFSEAVRLDPADAEYRNSLSSVLFAQQRYTEAEALLRQVTRQEKDNDTYLSNLAHTLFAQQRYDLAEDMYRQALRLVEGNSKYHDDLGTALFAQRKFTLAEAEYRKAAERAEAPPAAAIYRDHLAAALLAEGKNTDAATEYRTAIESDPDNADYHDKLAVALYHLRSYIAAESEERAAIRMATSAAQAVPFRINLARILLHQARVTEAEQELSAVAEVDADNAAAHGLLGNIMERQGQVLDAEANYRRSLAIEVSVSIRCNLGILLAKNRRFSEAAEENHLAITYAPTSWMPLYSLGLLALEQADEYHDKSYYDDAVQHFKDSLAKLTAYTSRSEQANMSAILHLDLGYAYGKQGQTARALAEFRAAKQISTYHSRTWFTADANIRRYRRREPAATSQRAQAAVFMILGVAVLAASVFLEWNNKITSPYLVTLLFVAVILFIIAFYLPIVTSIKLGPIALDKQAAGVRSDPPEPILSTNSSVDTNFEQWTDGELTKATRRSLASFTLPTPTATQPQPTPQETPPLPQPFGARPFGAQG